MASYIKGEIQAKGIWKRDLRQMFEPKSGDSSQTRNLNTLYSLSNESEKINLNNLDEQIT